MTALVTATEARRWLRLGPAGDPNDDADLNDKIKQASGLFLEFHNSGILPDEWTDGTSPPVVDLAKVPDDAKQAIAIILHDIWDGRGDKDPLERAYPTMRMLRGHLIA